MGAVRKVIEGPSQHKPTANGAIIRTPSSDQTEELRIPQLHKATLRQAPQRRQAQPNQPHPRSQRDKRQDMEHPAPPPLLLIPAEDLHTVRLVARRGKANDFGNAVDEERTNGRDGEDDPGFLLAGSGECEGVARVDVQRAG